MKKTLFLLLAACAVSTASAAEYWVKGVNQSGGWFDTNKTGNNDSGFCWAAADTNILSWWYQQNKAASKVADENDIPNTQEEIWDLYNSAFENSTGHPGGGLRWYMTGEKPQSTLKETETAKGAYYKNGDVTADITNINMFSYEPWVWDANEGLYIIDKSQVDPQRDVYLLIANDLREYITHGYIIALGVAEYQNKRSYQHAVTLWGIETDDTTWHLTRMWVTDSDDALYKLDDGQTLKYGDGLICIDCSDSTLDVGFLEDSDKLKSIGLTSSTRGPNNDIWYDFETKSSYIYDYTTIKLTSNIEVPEPTTATLSLLALAGLAARRRRK